jgi:hypothetical protein
MTVVQWALVAGGSLLAFGVVQLIYLSAVLSWGNTRTRGVAYYGLPPGARARFKRQLRVHAFLLFPIMRLLGRPSGFTFAKGSFQHRGIAGPKGTCSEKSFAAADAYQAQPEDIFVATQMKCGTTWMQHVVYQILHRGNGDLVETGRTLYAVSPWLEAETSVPIGDAPLLGTERPSRVIKTHFPSTHCPFSPEAKYVYVARHPVSCFASCADFVSANLGAFAPDLGHIEEWYCSEEWMWWGTWPAHVAGWWDLSQERENVSFVHFEEMKKDLARVVRQVADFLDVQPLTERELEQVVTRCGFQYMQEHAEAFEMHPPHIMAVDAELFVRGSADRHKDVDAARRVRLGSWSRKALAGSAYPIDRFYPDLAETT